MCVMHAIVSSNVLFFPGCLYGELDIVLLLDTSQYVSPDMWSQTKSAVILLLQYISNDMGFGSGLTQVGLVTHDYYGVQTILKVNDGNTLEAAITAINGIHMSSSSEGGFFAKGLVQSSDILSDHEHIVYQENPDAKMYKIIVPLVSSPIELPAVAIQFANYIKDSKEVVIVPILLFSSPDVLTTLQQVANNVDDVFVETIQTLPSLWQRHSASLTSMFCHYPPGNTGYHCQKFKLILVIYICLYISKEDCQR